MKIALAQLNYHTGNFEANTFKIISAIQQAKAAKVDLVVFGELAVCGYPPRDFLEFEHFIKLCYASIDEIKKACTHIACVIGAPYVNPKKEGKDLLNASYFIHEGEVKKVVAKQLLPTYDVFDEYRYFEIGTETEIVELNGTKIALTICEDMWNLGRFELYPVTPLDQLYWKEPQLIINVSASPFSYMQQHNRLEMLQLNASRYHLPTVYVNHVGAQTDLIFDGDSMAINPDGSVAARLASFEEAFDIVELDEKSGYFKPHPLGKAVSKTNVAPGPFNPDYGEIYDALIMGIKDYFDNVAKGWDQPIDLLHIDGLHDYDNCKNDFET